MRKNIIFGVAIVAIAWVACMVIDTTYTLHPSIAFCVAGIAGYIAGDSINGS